MRIDRTFDPQIVRSVMCHPAIWETVAEEGISPESWEPEMEADCWLSILRGDDCVGVYSVHPHNTTTLEIHANILPQYRKEYAFESGDLALKWILDEAPAHFQKVIAQIPAVYQNVVDFTLAHGFVIEGINRLSDTIDGVLCDQFLLGITRPEIEEYLRVKQRAEIRQAV